MFIRLNRKGQSTLEYAIIIAVVVAGLLMVQIYIKRSVQGRAREAADDIGNQYSAGLTTGNTTTTRNGTTVETITGGAAPKMVTNSNQGQTINNQDTTPAFGSEPAW